MASNILFQSKTDSEKFGFADTVYRAAKVLVSGNPFTEQGPFYPSEQMFRRLSAYVLSAVQIILLTLSLLVNFHEKNLDLLLPLGVALLPPLAALIWLRSDKAAGLGPLYVLAGSLITLGICLLLKQSAPDHSSLLWFVVFPPMAMFSMGLRHGSFIFVCFFLFLAALFFSPLEQYLADPIPMATRSRLLLSMFGAFLFTLCAEYFRYNIHRALERTMSRLEQESLSDPLTGLGNRRDFQKYFSCVVAKASRNAQPYCLALLDLDYFKDINDTHGHAIGDLILRHIAKVMNAHIRISDKLFRWGGEEFLLVMVDTSYEESCHALERLRAIVEATPFVREGLEIPCTVSIGVYCGNEDANIDIPLREADRRLYEAKRTGRNQVIC